MGGLRLIASLFRTSYTFPRSERENHEGPACVGYPPKSFRQYLTSMSIFPNRSLQCFKVSVTLSRDYLARLCCSRRIQVIVTRMRIPLPSQQFCHPSMQGTQP